MISVFELFKVGIGPSSSHTVGPMRAAAAFAGELRALDAIDRVAEVVVDLYGSLALTGLGHNIDLAVLLGLEGETPDGVDVANIDTRLAAIRAEGAVRLGGVRRVPFVEARHLRFHKAERLPFHTNGMRVSARDETEHVLLAREYYSIGGGFIVTADQAPPRPEDVPRVPYDFRTTAELLEIGRRETLTIGAIVLANERARDPSRSVESGLLDLWGVMKACTARGLAASGHLPGPLRVRRRAPGLAEKLRRTRNDDPLAVLDWVSVWAMAVNEENAAGGRVVTAPTNGASGLLPGVLHYYTEFIDGASDEGVCSFLLTAAAVGMLCKANASISGAEVGCQGEVGVACAMAAAGLVAALGGTNEQVEYAAETSIEHHLGMTCDPIGGLVQIPCIERNAVGAVQAIHAARIAMHDDAERRVSLDQVIETMRQTGRDMQASYKETALAGLAVNVIDC